MASETRLTVAEMLKQLIGHVRQMKPKDAADTPATALEPRPMSGSRRSVYLNLSTDTVLRRGYAWMDNLLRMGRLLEDLDTFAVYIGFCHNQGDAPLGKPEHRPMVIVTAAVDRIVPTYRASSVLDKYDLVVDRDIRFSGFVSWVGRSSMEVTISVEQESVAGDMESVATAKTIPVHPVLAETPEERAILAQGDVRKQERQKNTEDTYLEEPLTEEERKLLHSMFLQTVERSSLAFTHRFLPAGHVWMDDCRLKNLVICFPQNQNLNGKIFGGFLMRTASELAMANGAMFSTSFLRFMSMDSVAFRRPVDVGTFLEMSSVVCYTDGPIMQLRVLAEILNPRTGTRTTSNVFYFTVFKHGEGASVPRVMPKSYADGMLYLLGRRHLNDAIKHREEKIKSGL